MEKHVYLTVYPERLHEFRSLPYLFLSSLYDSEKPFTKDYAVRKVSSSLVSIKKEIQYIAKQYISIVQTVGSGFMLRFPIIILFGFFNLTFLISNNRSGEVSLMGLSLSWFTEFNTSFSLERSQEDILKLIVKGSVSGKL